MRRKRQRRLGGLCPLAPCAVLAAPPAAAEAKHTMASRRRCKVALVAAALVVIMPSAVGG